MRRLGIVAVGLLLLLPLAPAQEAAEATSSLVRRRARRAAAPAGKTEQAVELALKWLADHQDPDGRWDGDGFSKHDPEGDRTDGAGAAGHDVGLTGLSLLAFLGAGYTGEGVAPGREQRYAGVVRNAIAFLVRSQAEDGCLGERKVQEFFYDHAIATLALCDACGVTPQAEWKEAAQRAADYLVAARNPGAAWRYEPRGGTSDTSVTTWCVLALHSARLAGLRVDERAFGAALAWIAKMTEPEFGRVGYNMPGGASCRAPGLQERFPVGKTHSLTAAGILLRILCGEDPRTGAVLRKGADLCLSLPPLWNPADGSLDFYYWYLGTEAMWQMGGAPWRKWSVAMEKAIVPHQHPQGSGARSGSWDPASAWGHVGGRIYSTAILALTLEIHYRSERAFG